jgi:hypothetical protein
VYDSLMRTGLLLLLAACQDNKVGVYNTPPTVSVLSPADAATFDPGVLVEFFAVADDAQDDPDALAIAWESSLDGPLGDNPPDGDGNVYLATNTLSAGDHVITVTALDTDAESASASLSLTVGDGGTTPTEGAPTVVLLGPTEGQVFNASDAINLIAAVTDGEDAYDTLTCEIVDVPDGSVWTGTPSATGSLSVPLTLTAGTHALTLNALDSDGHTGTASVSFEVLEDGRPGVQITDPLDGASLDTTDLISFRGVVTDDETAVESLALSWSSDISGVFSTNPADSSGATSFGTALPAGIHTITLSATDETGLVGSDSIVVTVADPLDRDDDGDGYTENGGDCDDADPRANPGATDICDDADNDCSGGVNDGDWDSYERNETLGTAYDCGEVDVSYGWSASALTLSGLTLSDESDEDWFRWDAVDEWWDNVTIAVSVTGLPRGGTYVVELYDGDGNIVDSASGSGSLSVAYAGSEFDTDEDDWTLRVYAASWPSGTCSSTYTVVIRS